MLLADFSATDDNTSITVWNMNQYMGILELKVDDILRKLATAEAEAEKKKRSNSADSPSDKFRRISLTPVSAASRHFSFDNVGNELINKVSYQH